jgi:hypothetical protein
MASRLEHEIGHGVILPISLGLHVPLLEQDDHFIRHFRHKFIEDGFLRVGQLRMIGQNSLCFIEIQQKGKPVIIVFLVTQGNGDMVAIAERIGAIVILQDVETFEILFLEPVGHDRVQAFLIIDNTVRFDDVSPSSQY